MMALCAACFGCTLIGCVVAVMLVLIVR